MNNIDSVILFFGIVIFFVLIISFRIPGSYGKLTRKTFDGFLGLKLKYWVFIFTLGMIASTMLFYFNITATTK
jgi:hypothetical protein